MMWKICIPVPLLLLLLPAVCEGSSPPPSGSSGRIKFGQHYYKRTWEDARDYCRSKGTDLVTIRDENLQDFEGSHGWIGLHKRWSDYLWKWSKGDEMANFTRGGIARQVAIDVDVGQSCAYKLSGELEWGTDDCDEEKTFMCHEETLVLVKELKTWEEALEHCRALEAVDPSKPATTYQNHRYDLASLLTQDDHDEARQMSIKEAKTHEAWTGLRYLAGQWMWIGGGEVQYQGFDTCPLLRHCGVLQQRTTIFFTRPCFLKKNFLCYRKP